MKTNSDSIDEGRGTAQTLILEMVAGGATKAAVAKAVGVSDMTILSVTQGKTKVFRKLKKLQSVYSKWKAGSLDLSGKRGKKAVVAPVAMETTEGTKSSVKKPKVSKKPVVAEKAKRGGRQSNEPVVAVQTGFRLPEVTEEMIAEIEEQIHRLQAQAKYMRDMIAIRKKYGQ